MHMDHKINRSVSIQFTKWLHYMICSELYCPTPASSKLQRFCGRSFSLQELRQFLCWDSEGVEERVDTVVEELFSACDKEDDDTDAEPAKESKGGKKDGKGKKRKKKSSESKSSSSSSSTSSNGSSDDTWP